MKTLSRDIIGTLYISVAVRDVTVFFTKWDLCTARMRLTRLMSRVGTLYCLITIKVGE